MLGAAVVGVGTAGRVRIRDMLAPLQGSPAERLTLKGFVSRRRLESEQGVCQLSEEEVVKRDDIHVVFICTENASHEYNVRKFLAAGKHVCVEYPITLTSNAAGLLWDLAEEKGVVLHVEHIELMSADFKALQKEVQGKILLEGSLHFTGGVLKASSGFMSFSGIARLTWLVQLFGQLSVAAATMEEEPVRNYSKMTATLHTVDNKALTWTEERGPGLPRAKKIHFDFEGGSLTQIPPSAKGAAGLFMQDLVRFSSKLTGQVSPGEVHAEKSRILHCLVLAERIHHLCHGSSPGLTPHGEPPH
ncbi:biliverdin reductase A [Nerophis lumbriciformis]|uniref:biliverdin reductase A n=1 Tax=Nerophis lumbriciformis TaxID=546530 RepID=UPI002ADF2A71|nr:biliverdin reductase A-like [Nerophis lumbriciformis]